MTYVPTHRLQGYASLGYVERAKAILENDVDAELVEALRGMIADGSIVWRLDPEVDGVVGLVRANDRNRAVVVFYTHDGDFEVDGDFEETLA